MKNYQMTAEDLECGAGDVYQATVESKQPSRTWTWKIVFTVFLIALCGVAAAVFAIHLKGDTEKAVTSALKNNPATDHQEILTKIAKSTKAAIHLHVSGQSEENKPLKWLLGVDQSFSNGGLRLENNTIVIPSDGFYFVYSQASFAVPCEFETESSNMPLSYSIQWSSHAAPSTEGKYLLSGVKSACHPNSGEDQKNEELVYDVIYLGAIFRLYKDDKLSTEANYLAHIDRQSSKTFFGVFEL